MKACKLNLDFAPELMHGLVWSAIQAYGDHGENFAQSLPDTIHDQSLWFSTGGRTWTIANDAHGIIKTYTHPVIPVRLIPPTARTGDDWYTREYVAALPQFRREIWPHDKEQQ